MSALRKIRWLLLAAGLVAIVALVPPGLKLWRTRQRASLKAACQQARDAGRWDELVAIARPWSEWDGQNADPWLLLAEAAEARRDYAAVAECLQRVPESDRRVTLALVKLSEYQFGPLNQPLAGAATCERLLEMEPRATVAHQRLIQFYAMTVQRRKLVEQIRFAIAQRREPREAYVYLLLLDTLRLSQGVELNRRWLESDPDSELFQVALAMQMPEQNDQAAAGSDGDEEPPAADKKQRIAALRTAFPANLELLAYEIDGLVMHGDSDRVAELLLQSPPEAGQDSRFWRFKGWLHEARDELDQAQQSYVRALELNPLDWATRNRQVQVYRRQKNLAAVERTRLLVEQAAGLRRAIRELPAAELVTTEILAELLDYAENCGDEATTKALRSRLEGP